jgi:hypothetical protein
MLGRLGWSLARFVGLVFVLAGAWVFFINLIGAVTDGSYEGWVLVWILVAGVAGAVGGALFLLSIDGPERFRTRRTRLIGWLVMWGLATLPSALMLVLAPFLVFTIPALVHDPESPAPRVLEPVD